MPAPFALFYIDRLRKHLRIVAIQLSRNDNDNEVFLPSDPQPIWLAAKMWFNNAEAIIHKSSVLIGNSHMLLESIATSVHRQLSPSHPVYRLIIFSIKDVIPINNFEIVPLTKGEGFLHRTTNVGAEGCMKLVERGWAEWRMDVNGWLPSDLESRNVQRTDILPIYPYRDDSILLFNAFHEYVKEVLMIYYDENKLKDDWEVQNWGKELTCSTGSSIKVFPV
ncbi:Hydroperoxide isomerase ALOXE3 [Thelohanellus kitauei]|uniref:Hydroperoxide isomerase ALOXE3 n=1 Tax=Thelohanellus kitauei TaxID=669202 RepID=A0A0C2MNC7_THEKT|nr:Hydroperoxide isomerase ALOXE3 [Thelohanellus kitauei]